jgi:hypothetical protein
MHFKLNPMLRLRQEPTQDDDLKDDLRYVRLLALPTNVRLGCQDLPGAKAY